MRMTPYVSTVMGLALALVLSGCAGTPGPGPGAGQTAMTPMQAVFAAASAAPGGVQGPFRMQVQASGRQGVMAYLNSELDYRDQRNLTLALPPPVQAQLEARLGGDPLEILKGKTLLVEGEARRTRIDFTRDGQPTGLYYYQTHVTLHDAAQLTVLD